jgi:thiosulfate/3-mercaptopyruvate sulfurtransferase
MVLSPLISAADAVGQPGSVWLDARAGAGARGAWRSGHAAGARFVDLERDLSDVGDPSAGGRHPLPDWSSWLERVGLWGIEPSTPVLIYDANGGGMAAARAWWMLRAIGHRPLSVVDGGWDALVAAGVVIEQGPVHAEAVGPYPSSRSGWPGVDAVDVERIRNDETWVLFDARAPDRYAGVTEPLDPVAGHISGAVNAYWQQSLDEEGRFLPAAQLRRRFFELLRDTPPERVVCYCGSGVTACHLVLAMESCGLSGAGLYVGSWSEWCRTRPDAISSG